MDIKSPVKQLFPELFPEEQDIYQKKLLCIRKRLQGK